jgi:muramoyltetrapeptide carboxypeptidase
MQKIFSPKLKAGDTVQIIAPACSLGIISQENREIASRRFEEMGLKIIFGKHVEEMDEFRSASIESRIEDLHDAFRDPEVKAVFAVIGGFNSNQLLKYINWDLIKNNPKIFCGY